MPRSFRAGCPATKAHHLVTIGTTRVHRLLILATAFVVAFGAVRAAAAPSIADLRAQVERIQSEVAAIDAQVEDAAEAYNGAVYRLQQIEERIAQNRRTLQKAQRDLATSRRLLSARLRSAYMRPRPSTLELILSSRNLSTVVSGTDALRRARRQDATVVQGVRALRVRTIAARRELLADETRAEAEVTARQRQRDAVVGLLRRRQTVLAGAQGALGRALAAERERQRRAEAAAQREALERVRANNRGTAAGSSGSTPPAGSGAVVSGPGSAANAQAARVALRYLGVPYVWGGASPSGFDCSGLASYAYAQVGKSVPHYTVAIWGAFPRVTGPLQPGDLVFYRGLGHMGIYIGGGSMVHAPSTGDVVKITAMSSRSDYVGAVRP